MVVGTESARHADPGPPRSVPRPGSGWVILATGLFSYLLSGFGTWLAARPHHWSLGFALRRWDGVHYLTIAQSGYPTAPMPAHGPVPRSDWAFFPGYPLGIRGLHELGVPWHVAGWAINGGSGL